MSKVAKQRKHTKEPFWQIFDKIIDVHGWKTLRTKRSRVSIDTFHNRVKRLRAELHRLRSGYGLQYKIKSPYNLKQKHIRALVKDWIDRDLSTGYILNGLSMLRAFSEWTGKPRIVQSNSELLAYTKHLTRKLAAQEDKSWEAAGIDPSEKLAEITADDDRIGCILSLMDVYGLRLKEGCLIRPHFSDNGNLLYINRGSKGGRSRIIETISTEQRAVLDWAKRLTPNVNHSMTPIDKTFQQYRHHVYYILKKHGITRALIGSSSHGLRHGNFNRLYQQLTGKPSPIQGGRPDDVPYDEDMIARHQIAEAAGHSRASITDAYCGERPRFTNKKSADVSD